jgi:pimeloyl-ACP methyl ester carboxylesterase
MTRRLAIHRTRAMHWPALAVVALATLLPSVEAFADTPPPGGALIDEPCDIEVIDEAVAVRLRCARLHVLRDPADPSAGRFEIAVAIRRSATPKPGAAPVLFLHGGPGGQFTRWIGMSGRDPAPGHDLVAFDMRGGGRSTPRVCEQTAAALFGTFTHVEGPAVAAAERWRIAEDCRIKFRAAGFDARHFGTPLNVSDAEALREALGVEQWLLFGESYGTTVAAHYVASHPERIAAAVLDSLYPADEFVLPTAEMQGRLVERVAGECAQDPTCAASWPDFGRAQLDAAVAALDAEPLSVGRGSQRRLLDGMALRTLIAITSTSEAGVRSLPMLIDAAARRDTATLAGPTSLFAIVGDASASFAAMAATDCRDRPRHHTQTGLADPITALTGLPSEVCRAWASPGETPRWPVGTTVPILVLAGGYDSFQPPASAVVATLGSGAQLLEVPFAAHGVRGAGPCTLELIGSFLASPDKALDTGCIGEMTPPSFVNAVTPLPGPARLFAALAGGAAPPTVALVAAGAAATSLMVALIAGWRRWRRKLGSAAGLCWSGVSALAAITAVGAPAVLVASTDPLASAALLYGVPPGWGWLPWLGLLPASVGALALWLGDAWPPRIAGIAAILVAVAMTVGGWSVFG